ncbi:hypothetical protein PAXRUDRAFT_143347 [Paxillus rubicundulus Ve08.2h10]|uniref:Uncharacterized protein n=1 Tax=Paxillus rubicundulus Ve08.2h10 TaxID=930991 RepID=A0A0D0DAQ4_9AGAM|nr:hypothetical protein PAXRUDRAFT_143347 [Paxillus rubicundulus Ve08.2h10]
MDRYSTSCFLGTEGLLDNMNSLPKWNPVLMMDNESIHSLEPQLGTCTGSVSLQQIT